MLIFGWREYVDTRDKGEFYCRPCRGWQPYAYQVRRTYFTLFFIRTGIPAGEPEEYVQCLTCGRPFDIRALRYNPDAKSL